MTELQQLKRVYARLGIRTTHCTPEKMRGLRIPKGALHVICEYDSSTKYWFDNRGDYLGRTSNGNLIPRTKEGKLTHLEYEDWGPHGKNPFIKDGPTHPHPNKKY